MTQTTLPSYRPLAVNPAYLDGTYAARGSSASPADSTYSLVHGVAVIPVVGALAQYASDTTTGYDWIKATFLKALHDPKAKAIALVIDSGGGEVAGCFDLVDLIYGSRAVKPLMAICAEHAYSAAYALASACERVSVPRTGGVGSVGVIAAHTDLSGMYRSMGVEVSVIHHGDRKADGHESAPLSPEARARMQSDVDAMGDLFVGTVSRNRGLSIDAVAATQAGTYMGQSGVAIGFADAVLSPDDAFLALLDALA